MNYKVGDRVLIKSLDWYNENKDEYGFLDFSTSVFVPGMSQFCGKIVTIEDVFEEEDDVVYCMEGIDYDWTDEMIEGLVEEEAKPKFKVGDKVKWYNHTCNITSIDTYENTYIYLIKYDDYREDATFARWVPESELTFEDDVETKPKYEDEVNGEYYSTPKYLVRPSGYIFKDENGNIINATKIVLEKKKKEYPKTYEECCKVLGYDDNETFCICHTYANERLFESLYRLKVCRDAYWKIAGEEMGLGKPWEPDWKVETPKYIILCKGGEIQRHITCKHSRILAFPAEEMRDAFYENFKSEIEICKELL